jgi:DNA-binding response OmpR family regulator
MFPPPPELQDYLLPVEPGDRRDALQRGVEARSERILVVDDDPDIARFVQVNLVGNGPFADVVIAGDGEEALRCVEDEPFELIITGVVMPKIDGYELVRRLRERSDTAETPIMFLTARSSPEHVAEGYAAGADDYMIEPFDPVELLAHVRALLRRRRG